MRAIAPPGQLAREVRACHRLLRLVILSDELSEESKEPYSAGPLFAVHNQRQPLRSDKLSTLLVK